MALTLKNFCGFETGGLEEAAATAGSPTPSSSFQRTGDYRLRLQSITDQYDISAVIGQAKSIWGLGIRWGTAAAYEMIRWLDANGVTIFILERMSSGRARLFVAGNDTYYESTNTFTVDQWDFVEFYFNQADTGGEVKMWVDGVEEISVTGIDTNPAAAGFIATLRLCNTSLSYYWSADDVYAGAADADTDRLGDCEVFRYQANTDSVTPDTGDALNTGVWQNCGQTPDGTAEAAYTGTPLTGAVYTNDTASGLHYRHGPHGDANIDGDSNIKAGKWLFRLKRGTGGTTTHYTRVGNDADGLVDESQALTTAYANYARLRTDGYVPLSTQHFALGFAVAGAQDMYCQEMWAMLLHVPTGAVETTGTAQDSLRVTEARLSRYLTHFRTDALDFIDIYSALHSLGVEDAAAITENLLAASGYRRSAIDSIGLDEILGKLQGAQRIALSTLLAADSPLRLIEHYKILDDTVGVTESPSTLRSWILRDNLGLLEDIYTSANRYLADALLLAAETYHISRLKIQIDSLLVADTAGTGAAGALDLLVSLMQGATEIASWNHPGIGSDWATASQTLSTAQAASITDYSNLRLRFTADGQLASQARVSWAEVQMVRTLLEAHLSTYLSASDALSLAEALRLAHIFVLSDATRLADLALTGGQTYGKAIDALGLADLLLKSLSIGVQDTSLVKDAVYSLASTLREFTDSLALLDIVAATRGLTEIITDTSTLGDRVSAGRALSVEETLRLADILYGGRRFGAVDSLLLADAISKAVGRYASYSDALQITEALSLQRLSRIDDVLTLADLAQAGGLAFRQVTDTLTIAEALLTDRAAFFADTMTASELLSTRFGLQRSVSDSLLIAEALRVARASIVSETLRLAEADLSIDRTLALADILSLADAILSARGIKLAETISLQEQLGRLLGATASVSDAIKIAEALEIARTLILADVVGVADLLIEIGEIERFVADALTLVDGIKRSLRISLKDVTSMQDALSWLAARSATLADSLSVLDSLQTARNLMLSDAVEAKDIISLSRRISVTSAAALNDFLASRRRSRLVDSLLLQDLAGRISGLSRQGVDSLRLADSIEGLSGVARLVSDVVVLAEALSLSRDLKAEDSLALLEVVEAARRLGIADQVAIAEVQLSAISGRIRLVSDALDVSDSLKLVRAYKVIEQLALAEALKLDRKLTIAEALILLDSVGVEHIARLVAIALLASAGLVTLKTAVGSMLLETEAGPITLETAAGPITLETGGDLTLDVES